MIEGKCDVCGVEITPAETQQQYNRNLGLHKSNAHSISGTRKYIPVSQMTPEQYAHYKALKAARKSNRKKDAQRKYKQNWKKKAEKEGNRQALSERAAEPLRLDHCPHCHARFFIVVNKL